MRFAIAISIRIFIVRDRWTAKLLMKIADLASPSAYDQG